MAQLSEYPVRGLVFEAGESLMTMAHLVGSACQRLQVGLIQALTLSLVRLHGPRHRSSQHSVFTVQAANIPHNVLVVDCGQRLFLFPNNFSTAKAAGAVPEDLMDTQVDPAAFEIAGHLILKRSQDYQNISQVQHLSQHSRARTALAKKSKPMMLLDLEHLVLCAGLGVEAAVICLPA